MLIPLGLGNLKTSPLPYFCYLKKALQKLLFPQFTVTYGIAAVSAAATNTSTCAVC